MSLSTVIVDDSFFVRETLSRMIIEEGHQVINTYDCAQDILDNLNSIDPNVLFLDIILPDKSGLEILASIKEKLPFTKIVMLSGMTQGNTIAAALRLGATDFVSKPISKGQLSELMEKFSSDVKMPSVEELSTIGVGTILVTNFISELSAHASTTLREVIQYQARSIMEYIDREINDMFIVDLEKISIEPNPELWGTYTEDEVFIKLATIPTDLIMELQFLYQEDFINNLFTQAILTMSSRNREKLLFDLVSPSKIGLPNLPKLGDHPLTELVNAGTSFEELEKAISVSVYIADPIMGPSVISHINTELLEENDVIKNSIFYSTLVGVKDDNFQEGLFGPLPVSINSDISLAALVYTMKIRTIDEEEPRLVLITFYFTASAEKIVADYNRLSFIIKTRLSTINYAEEMDRGFLRGLHTDVINFILE